jgi:hypothetical protein
MRQLDVQADTFDAGLGGAFVGRFHDPAAAAGNDRKTGLPDLARGFYG